MSNTIKRTYKYEVLHKIEYFNDKNELHSDNDEPAYIKYYKNTKTIKCKRWYKNGKLHRDNFQPAIIHYSFYSENIIYNSPYRGSFIEKQEYYNNDIRYDPIIKNTTNEKPMIRYIT